MKKVIALSIVFLCSNLMASTYVPGDMVGAEALAGRIDKYLKFRGDEIPASWEQILEVDPYLWGLNQYYPE